MENIYLEEKENKNGFNLKRYFLKLLKNSGWLIISTAIFLGGAYLYLLYTIPLYQVSTYILIKQPTDGSNLLGGSAFTNSGSSNTGNNTDANNEIIKLQSEKLIGEVVDSLKLDIQLTKKHRVQNEPVDLDLIPFTISINKASPEHSGPLYKLSLSKDSYKLQSENRNVTGKYNEPLIVNGDTINIKLKEQSFQTDNLFGLKISSRSNTISNYASRLKVGVVPKAGPGMLSVSVLDEIPKRAKKIIDVLIYKYDLSNLDFKNQALRMEMAFLNNRLTAVSKELEEQELKVKDFKVANRINDVSAAANQLLGSLPGIDMKKSEVELKSGLLTLVESNIDGYNGKEDIVPTASGLQDPVLSDMIGRYNQLILQKRMVLDKGTAQDPRLTSINGQLQEIRSNIRKNVENIRRELNTNSSSLSTQERNIIGRYSSIPGKEKEYIELNRLLGIKQAMYVFLLQKKEDKNIQLASSEVAESRIIDNKAKNTKTPNPPYIYLFALGAGLLLPSLIILIRFLLSKKIETREDVELHSTLPIAGEIGNAPKKKQNILVTPDAISSEAEQFRTLRTNISYAGLGSGKKVFLVTSCITDEGKSFISLNLANSIAITDKKVALLEFDLRNPGLYDKLGFDNSVGLINFLKGEATIEQIIQPVKESENLFFISAGYPLVPNPGELILNNRMDELFVYLKEHYDVIIMDTPPVEAVSDALTLGKYADHSLFVVRHKYTSRTSLALINQLNEEEKLPHLSLIINGIRAGYGYTHGYGYGYGHTAKDKKRNRKRYSLN